MTQTQPALPPEDLEALREQIVKRFDSLSQRLQQVAEYFMAQPSLVAVENMTTLAENAGVPTSTLSRFANEMGFSGFSKMQSLFREQYLVRPRDYHERLRQASRHDSNDSLMDMFMKFSSVNLEAIEKLQLSVSEQKLEKAINLLKQAEIIYVHGMRRAYPVASYLYYALLKSDKKVMMLDDNGGMLQPQTGQISKDDVLLTVTYSPYAAETTDLISKLHEKGTPIVAISDSQMSPQGKLMNVCFEVEEGEVMGFRSLSSSMLLAQCLAVGLLSRDIS